MNCADDHPWPDFGDVGRGATRGNQGHKGFLSSPDEEGRCVLQLRVQFGSLEVSLNPRMSEWYKILFDQVNVALKQAKAYWRKARRRQDYDARADQDHMELHEWLQQLKDRAISHVDSLVQKGEVQGPPYIMPEHIELTFMRKFIERHFSGISHNPRLRPIQSLGAVDHDRFPTQSMAGTQPAEETGQLYDTYSLSPQSDLLSIASTSTNMLRSPIGVNSPTMAFEAPHTAIATRNGHGMLNIVDKITRSSRILCQIRERKKAVRACRLELLAKYQAYVQAENMIQAEEMVAEERRDEFVMDMMRNSNQRECSQNKRKSEDHFIISPTIVSGDDLVSSPISDVWDAKWPSFAHPNQFGLETPSFDASTSDAKRASESSLDQFSSWLVGESSRVSTFDTPSIRLDCEEILGSKRKLPRDWNELASEHEQEPSSTAHIEAYTSSSLLPVHDSGRLKKRGRYQFDWSTTAEDGSLIPAHSTTDMQSLVLTNGH